MTEVIDYDGADYFSDEAVHQDPYAFYEHLRSRGPVTWMQPGVVAVTGYEEAHTVYRDPDTYSSINAPTGPYPPLPFTPDGDDISAQIDEHRHEFPLFEHMAMFDPPEHTAHRALLMRLLTPKRIKENEAFMWVLADRLLDEFVPDGKVEIIKQYSQRFTLLVICELLGVPEEDYPMFREMLIRDLRPTGDGAVGGVNKDHSLGESAVNPFAFLDEQFTAYVEDRRANPRDDVLTHLATTTFPDGTLPPVSDVVHLATFVFVAGHETTAKLIGQCVRVIAEDPELQEKLRSERDLIPGFVEEALRMEGPTKSHFRLVKRTTELAGVHLPAGTTVMIAIGGINRDPNRFPDPFEFQIDRPNVRDHVAFARGVHSCPGGALARIETRVTMERILDRMLDIRLSEEHHGPPGNRRFAFEPTYVLRGLEAVNVVFTPAPEPGRA